MNYKFNFKQNIRIIFLVFFLILFSVFSIRHFVLGGRVAASIDALCPFGGFETLFTYIVSGGFVPKILISGLILAVGILFTTLILGKGFCGYICPFGAVQEVLAKLNMNNKTIINSKFDNYAKLFKYFLLVMILIGTYLTTSLIFSYIDPFKTFFHFGRGVFWGLEESLWISVFTFVFTILILIGSYYINRFWCRYLCPLGATMNLFSFFRRTKIVKATRGEHKCINCGICNKNCPMQVNPSKHNYVKSIDCINCNKCVFLCPKKALKIKTFGKSISPFLYAILVVMLFFGVILISNIIGIWVSVPGTSISTGNTLNPDLIKGWMTITDVSLELGISPETLRQNLGLLDNVSLNVSFKDLSLIVPGFETEVVREYVRTYNTLDNSNSVECPWGIINETIPRCGFYDDLDNNGYCDLSE